MRRNAGVWILATWSGVGLVAAAGFAGAQTWGAAERIDQLHAAGSSQNPSLAADANGNLMALFEQSDGARRYICANRCPAGGGAWTGAAVVSAPDANPAYSPRVAYDGDGNAVAVFLQSDGAYYRLLANRYLGASGRWTGLWEIDACTSNNAYNPQISPDPDGNAVAVFEQTDGSNVRVYANRYSAASDRWGSAALIDAGNGNNAEKPQIACLSDGDAIAVFRQSSAGTFGYPHIHANRYRARTGAWSGAEIMDAWTLHPADNPAIAADGGGNAVAVFEQWGPAYNRIYANRYRSDTGRWETARRIDTGTDNNAYTPQIAFLPNGDAIAVFIQYEGSSANVYANCRTAADGRWAGPERIDARTGYTARNPHISRDGGGNAVVTFEQWDGYHYRVYANRRLFDGGRWAGAVRMDIPDGQDAGETRVACGASGNAAAAFYQWAGGTLNVYAARWTIPTPTPAATPNYLELAVRESPRGGYAFSAGETLTLDWSVAPGSWGFAGSPRDVYLGLILSPEAGIENRPAGVSEILGTSGRLMLFHPALNGLNPFPPAAPAWSGVAFPLPGGVESGSLEFTVPAGVGRGYVFVGALAPFPSPETCEVSNGFTLP